MNLKAGRPIISKWTSKGIGGSSLIRAMFERASQLETTMGKENVYNFSLGNPLINPPASVREKMIELAMGNVPGQHGYMNNAGYPFVREKVADHLNIAHQLDNKLTKDHIIMTCGAGAALNIIFKTILERGDQTIIPKPYFVEYNNYIGLHQAEIVPVPTRLDFQLDIKKILEAITPKTKAILINSPNNPTGAVYSLESLIELSSMISRKEREYGHKIITVTDEPYAELVYDGLKLPPTLKIFPHSIMGYSYSKSLGFAGERIGYIAINPQFKEASQLFNGMVLNSRVLGFVNAPAFMQKVVADFQGIVSGLEEYCARRDLLYKNLSEMGYDVINPQGAFYMMMKTPVENDVEFTNKALEYGLVMVPASAFEAPGYVRLSFSSISQENIQRSFAQFAELAKFYKL